MAENGVRFLSGQWNAICDVCGQKYKSGQMKKRWDGLMVCPNDWEPRHPQDFLRSVPDHQAVPWSRPQTPDVFIPSNWDRTLVDYTTMTEALSSSSIYFRYIPSMPAVQVLPPLERPLNGQPLNWGVLGGTDSALPLTEETVTLTESLQLGVSKAMSDSSTLTESIMFFIGTAITDDTDMTEYLSVTPIILERVLNGSYLNRGPL